MIEFLVMLVITAPAGLQEQPDAQTQSAVVSPPKPSVRQDRLIGSSAYPAEALRMHQEGKAVLTVHVSPKGKVTDCSVVESSRCDSLDAASCAFVRRVRFNPARDETGRAVEGDARFPMSWHLPAG